MAHENELDAAYNRCLQMAHWSDYSFEMKKGALSGILNFKVDINEISAFLKQKEPSPSNRVRDTEFGISSTERIEGDYEMNELCRRVNMLFGWYDKDWKRYAAPCMPIVQSSGTGKTKLMYDFRHSNDDRIVDYDRFLINCLEKDVHGDGVYDRYLCLNTNNDNIDRFQEELTKLVARSEKERIVLLLDEAQELTRPYNGRRMNTLRKFLRRKREGKKVVAFFFL